MSNIFGQDITAQSANNTFYDNTISGLAADDVQEAIDEVRVVSGRITVVADIAARNALSPATGQIVFVQSDGFQYIWTGLAWVQNVNGGNLVSSVNSQTGAVVLTTTNINEGTNLYYNQGRFDSAFGAKSTTNLPEGTNLYYTTGRFDSAFGSKTTDNLPEGPTKKYYSTSLANTDFDTRLATKSTTNLSEGTNLYYTQGRFDSAFGSKTTDNLSEGPTKKYYSTSLFNTDLATKTTTNLSEGTNLYYTQGRFDSAFGAKSTSNLNEGSNLYFTTARNQQLINDTTPSTTNTFSSTKINTDLTNHTSNTSNPHNITKAQVGLSEVLNIKHNISASAPSTSNDSTQGYSVGSRWTDTALQKDYVCTSAGVGVAQWKETTLAGGGGGTVNSASNIGGGVGVFKTLASNNLEFKSLTSTTTKIALSSNTNDIGIDVVENQINYNNLLNKPDQALNTTSNVGFNSLTLGSGATNFTLPTERATTTGRVLKSTGGSGVAWQDESGEANTIASVGTGASLAAGKSGLSLQVKSLVAGTGISIANQGTDEIKIDANVASNSINHNQTTDVDSIALTGSKKYKHFIETPQTSAEQNSYACGQNALPNINATGALTNIAIGGEALQTLTSGSYNTGIGRRALQYANGSYNLGIGFESCRGNTFSGSHNTAIGRFALKLISTGNSNTAIGSSSDAVQNTGSRLTTGSFNSLYGGLAGQNITTGSNNTCIGYNSDCSALLNNQTALGSGALCDSANQIVLGDASVSQIKTMNNNLCDLGSATARLKDIYCYEIKPTNAVTIETVDTVNQAFPNFRSTKQKTASVFAIGETVGTLEFNANDINGSVAACAFRAHATNTAWTASSKPSALTIYTIKDNETGATPTLVLNSNRTMTIPKKQSAGDPSGTAGGDIWYSSAENKFKVNEGGTIKDWISTGGGGSGDVVGPSSSNDNEIVLFNAGTGKLIKASSMTISGQMLSSNNTTAFNLNNSSGGISLTASGDLLLQSGSSNINTTGSFVPTTNNIFDAGSSAFRFRNAYFQGNVRIGSSTSDYKMPSSRGVASGQVLQTDGVGNVSWATLPTGLNETSLTTTSRSYTSQQGYAITSEVAAPTFTWTVNTKQIIEISMNQNITSFNVDGVENGCTYVLHLIQDNVGGRTISGWSSQFKWPNNVPPTLSTGATKIDIITFVSRMSNLYGVATYNF